jgi:hypothetical protein
LNVTRRQRKLHNWKLPDVLNFALPDIFFLKTEDVMGGKYVMCGGNKKCVQSFDGETGSMETTLSNKELGRI